MHQPRRGHARKCERDRLAARGRHAQLRRIPHDLPIVAVGQDEAGVRREHLVWKFGRDGEKQPVAIVPVLRPFGVGAKVGNARLDFNNPAVSGWAESHDIGSPAICQHHLGQALKAVRLEDPLDAAQDLPGGWREFGLDLDFCSRWRVLRGLRHGAAIMAVRCFGSSWIWATCGGGPSDEAQQQAADDGARHVKFFWRAKNDDAQGAALKRQDDSAASGAVTPDGTRQSEVSQTTANEKAGETETAANGTTDVNAKNAAARAESRDGDGGVAASAEGQVVGTESNVVALQPARLSERIAAAAVKTVVTLTASEPSAAPPALASQADTLTPRAAGPLPGQEAAYDHLGRLFGNPHVSGNILVLGPVGSGRRTAVKTQLERHRGALPRPQDWLYIVSAADGRRLRSFAMPHGQGAMLAREAKAAISKAKANHERLIAGDEFRLGLEIIDEEFRHKTGKTLDSLKRRAEEQNIALVKTPDGFVLAPMHEGKVVRNDVFRALPEQLQRDVEAKIAGLEGELKAFIDALPGDDTQQAERIASFNRDAAVRAVKPQLEPVRLAFNECGDFIDELQASLIAVTAASSRLASGDGARIAAASVPDVQVLAVQTAMDFSQPAPVVMAHDVTPAGLLGELGIDAAGQLALSPGAMAQANGGYLIVEAWRLVANPSAWCALSAGLATGELRSLTRGGLLADIDPLPFSGRLIVIADEASFDKLLTIDPGARRHFPHVVRFRASVPRSAFDMAGYASFAARIAAQAGLRPIAANAADALYRAAISGEGAGDRLTLDTHALANLLMEADFEAAASQSPHINAQDVEAAAKRAAEARLP